MLEFDLAGGAATPDPYPALDGSATGRSTTASNPLPGRRKSDRARWPPFPPPVATATLPRRDGITAISNVKDF